MRKVPPPWLSTFALIVAACSSSDPSGTATAADAPSNRTVPSDGAAEGAAAPSPSPGPGPRTCLPHAVCGCEMGCLLVRPVGEPGVMPERFRVEEGPMNGQVLIRPAPDMPLQPDGAETCDESCRHEPARHRCSLVGDGCVQQE